jgi:hypothetical protein
MEEILKKLDSIEQRLDKIETHCYKMSGHVDFVERAYNVIRKPLNYLLGTPIPILSENKKLCLIKE